MDKNPTSFLSKTLQAPAFAKRIGAAGRVALEAHYNWRKVYRLWDEVYG